MYKLVIAKLGGDFVQRLSDGAIISCVPENPHYQAYLAWLAEGNEPEPADEVTG
jgi:hypothetical protein